MASKYFDLTIDFYQRNEDFFCAVRKREAPEDYQLGEAEVRAIIKTEFHGQRDHARFIFSTKKICKEKFNKSVNRIIVEADFGKPHENIAENQQLPNQVGASQPNVAFAN